MRIGWLYFFKNDRLGLSWEKSAAHWRAKSLYFLELISLLSYSVRNLCEMYQQNTSNCTLSAVITDGYRAMISDGLVKYHAHKNIQIPLNSEFHESVVYHHCPDVQWYFDSTLCSRCSIAFQYCNAISTPHCAICEPLLLVEQCCLDTALFAVSTLSHDYRIQHCTCTSSSY